MRKKTTEEFIADARKVHGDRYDYSKVEYVNAKTKVCVICPEHGEFWQIPNDHLNKHGCFLCGGSSKGSTNLFIEKARLLHGKRYDYSKVFYVNAKTKVKIICKHHGEFMQSPNDHLNGRGCAMCKSDKMSREQLLTSNDFILSARIRHGDRYDYGKVNYIGSKEKVCITCHAHGDFMMRPNDHLNGQCCPKCSSVFSKGESEVFELIKRYYPDAQQRVRGVIPPLELDIYIPSLKLAVEYNGEFWHSVDKKGKNYHLNKRHACEAAGVRLISVCETDWKTKRERVERIILNAMGKTSSKTVYARKCEIREVICKDYRAFMNENHIQGYAIATHRYGLYHDDELVACMGFNQLKDGVWDCVRYATGCRVLGGHSKLFKFMAKELSMERAQSFVDMDFFTGGSYREEDGWVDSGSETVGFRVWHQKVGFMPRQKWWKDFIPKTLEQLGADPAIYDRNKKQRQMMEEAGCLVIENSGNKKFVWHK
uniref:Homing endonuclease n=1 Tax=Salmonella phage vB_STmST19_KE08 TaxID=3161165 RepID=A0AAU8GGL7_9CAUD